MTFSAQKMILDILHRSISKFLSFNSNIKDLQTNEAEWTEVAVPLHAPDISLCFYSHERFNILYTPVVLVSNERQLSLQKEWGRISDN